MEDHRVCILDPIKSDWWGMTLAADGKNPGLPFNILGGPHGHLPLHAGAGKALAEVVASGALPLSILDMADFGPGGHAQFFSDFAETLKRRMKGVLYLVLEEAHLFAPKERAGMGRENESIYWAKMLATAGRSKGIRLIVATQRVQSLHNALLGSCSTLIALNLNLPADQKPVIDWLKGSAPKDTAAEIAGSLPSLETGSGWLCSGEAGIFERIKFPRIQTYDNTATPTGTAKQVAVETPAADLENLKTIIGDAVIEAEKNDPKALRAKLATIQKERDSAQSKVDKLEKQLETLKARPGKSAPAAPPPAMDAELVKALAKIHKISGEFTKKQSATGTVSKVTPSNSSIGTTTRTPPAAAGDTPISPTSRKIINVILRSAPVALSFDAAARRAGVSRKSSALPKYRKEVLAADEIHQRDDNRLTAADAASIPDGPGVDPVEEFAAKLPPSYARMLRAIAEASEPQSRDAIAILADVSPTSSGLAAGLKELQALGLIEQHGDYFQLHEDLRA